jgi:hypothetical protein
MCGLFRETGDVHLKITTAGVLALCLCAAPRIAAAQTMQWTDKGYATVSGGAQVGSHTLETSSNFDLYGEAATVSTSQKVKGGGFFDIGGAYRVWGRNLLGGLSVSHTSSDTSATFTASIPDPLFPDTFRNVQTSQSGAKHSETAVHLAAIWMMPVANKIDVGFFAGPSIFRVKQDTVGTLTVTEPGPTVSAPFASASKTTGGANFGVDAQYMVYNKIAVGVLARYSVGSTKLPGASKSLTVGGFQIGAGARYRF